MSDVFRLRGEFSAAPAVFELGVSQAPEILAPLLHSLYIVRRLNTVVQLDGDTPVSVSFGSLTGAHVLILQSTSKVRARLTSADGSAQSAPVDPLFVLISLAVPLTALDLTRQASVASVVNVFLGEKA